MTEKIIACLKNGSLEWICSTKKLSKGHSIVATVKWLKQIKQLKIYINMCKYTCVSLCICLYMNALFCRFHKYFIVRRCNIIIRNMSSTIYWQPGKIARLSCSTLRSCPCSWQREGLGRRSTILKFVGLNEFTREIGVRLVNDAVGCVQSEGNIKRSTKRYMQVTRSFFEWP